MTFSCTATIPGGEVSQARARYFARLAQEEATSRRLLAPIVAAIMAGGNPLVRFLDTYLMHDILQEEYCFMREVRGERYRDWQGRVHTMKEGRVCNIEWGQRARYRVDHGGFVTQQTWERDDHVPESETITPD